LKNLVAEFSTGLMAPFKGIETIFGNPKVRHAAILPFIVVLVVFVVGAVVGLPFLFDAVLWVANATVEAIGVDASSPWAITLYWIFVLISLPVAICALLLALFLSSQLLATPFYAFLAERALLEAGLKEQESLPVWRWLMSNAHLFFVAIVKVLVYALLGTSFLIMSLLPGVGIFAAFGLLLMAAFDIVDISLDALNLGLRARLRFFQEELAAISGLAAMLGLVFLIPGLNFFLFPAAIVGSSEIIARSRRFEKRGK